MVGVCVKKAGDDGQGRHNAAHQSKAVHGSQGGGKAVVYLHVRHAGDGVAHQDDGVVAQAAPRQLRRGREEGGIYMHGRVSVASIGAYPRERSHAP